MTQLEEDIIAEKEEELKPLEVTIKKEADKPLYTEEEEISYIPTEEEIKEMTDAQ